MKKIILVVLVFFLFLGSFSHAIEPVIPKESFRFRIIANSNSNYDQEIKQKVRLLLNPQLFDVIQSTSSVLETKQKLISILPNIKNILDQEVPYSYDISFGQNYFPEKKYKGEEYAEGYYESLVITLGAGAGENWWCVLFPPFCMLDATEEENQDDIEYDFFLFDFFESLF